MRIKYVGKQIEYVRSRETNYQVLPQLSAEHLRLFKPILAFLNTKDRDILYLIFVSGKKQNDVKRILGRSQSSLCYDIKKIRQRLKFIFYIQSMFDVFLEFLNSPQAATFTSEELEVMTLMFYTSSFTVAANVMGLSQVRVRYIFNRCVLKLKGLQSWPMYEILSVIVLNLNIIRRLYKRHKTATDCRVLV